MTLSQLHTLFSVKCENDCELWPENDIERSDRDMFKGTLQNMSKEAEYHENPQSS